MEPRTYTVVVALRGYPDSPEALAERIRAAIETHPTLSVRVDSVQTIEGAGYVTLDTKPPADGPPSVDMHGRHVGEPGFGTLPVDMETLTALSMPAPIVAYDRDNPPKLPAFAFKPGERVMGEDDGEKLTGTVSDRMDGRRALEGDVLVYWDSVGYEPGSLGNMVPATLLRLWPARLHRVRLLQVAIGEDLDTAAPCPRPAGESDDAFRERAIAAFVASGLGL